MQLIFNVDDNSFKDGCVVTIGNFDGVHKGHQEIIKTTLSLSKKHSIPTVVVLFEPQPLEFFQKSPVRLSSLRDKVCDIKKFGVDYIYCLKFNAKLAEMEPTNFVEEIIFKKLNAHSIVVGKDFKFGKNKSGDVLLLEKLLATKNVSLTVCDDFIQNNNRISSTLVRQNLLNDNVAAVNEFLGHPYWLRGRVIKGDQRGRQWGIPTANIKLPQINLAIQGVYCVSVSTDDKQDVWFGVANVGIRPTINGKVNLLEVHLLDFNESLYGKILRVSFLHKLRNEVKFSTVDDLIVQIKQDIADTRQYFRVNND